MIVIVDYGAGNLNSVKKAFTYLGAEIVVTDQPATLAAADKIVFPGVGHFSSLRALGSTGLREALLQAASASKPFLGICRDCRSRHLSRQVPAVSVFGEVAACRLEFSDGSARVTLVARHRTGFLCLLHALFPCASGCRDGGGH